MPYVENRIVHDADSHLMELGDCLDPYIESAFKARYHALESYRHKVGDGALDRRAREIQADPGFRADEDANLLLRKNYQAMGAFLPEDRPKALNLLGFASQLIFSTFCLGNFGLDESGQADLAYATARAHNRMMVDFCKVDRRLLPTAYVPLVDFEMTAQTAREAIALGAKALMIPSRCPPGHSPSHIGFDPLWAMAQEAGLPILFHVGGETKMADDYAENGLPRVKDFHGGEENFTSVSFMAIPTAVMQTLSALIFDGVMDRFPRLKFGAIELGASWLPSFMRYLDAGQGAFLKHEERLQKLSMRPSEIVRRQVRVTPYPHEDAGWIISQSGDEICLFSSDFPHIEGGRNPLKRFNDSLGGVSANAVQRFYCDNFIDLMGAGLAEDLRHPAHLVAA